MEEKQLIAIGDRVEQLCVTCGEERGHIVASLSKTGKITRISCPKCGSRVAYKGGLGRGASTSASGAPYDRSRTYRRGQTMLHPLFGEGEVMAIVEPDKMDVLFSDRIRRLIHARV